MIDLAERWGGGYVALKDIAQRQDVSKKYLEQIVSLLVKHDLVIAARGFSGGYKLADEPAAITAAKILEATEGSIDSMVCADERADCAQLGECPSLKLWCGLESAIRTYLESVTLADLSQAS